MSSAYALTHYPPSAWLRDIRGLGRSMDRLDGASLQVQ